MCVDWSVTDIVQFYIYIYNIDILGSTLCSSSGGLCICISVCVYLVQLLAHLVVYLYVCTLCSSSGCVSVYLYVCTLCSSWLIWLCISMCVCVCTLCSSWLIWLWWVVYLYICMCVPCAAHLVVVGCVSLCVYLVQLLAHLVGLGHQRHQSDVVVEHSQQAGVRLAAAWGGLC